MRKKLIILLLCALVVCSVTIGCVYADDPDAAPDESGGETAYEPYTVEIGDATLSVDPHNLNMSIAKNGRVWYSGKRHVNDEGEIDDGLSEYTGALITDGIIITYRNINSNNKIPQTDSVINLAEDAITFEGRDDGFDAKVRIRGNIGLSFTLKVRFDGTTLTATIPASSIVETSANIRLEQISLFPYFDSSYMQTEGQIFVPDGSGALIDMSVRSNAKKGYAQRIYGEDFALTTPSARANQPERATMPVIATLYPDGGTTTIVTGGAEYVKANAAVSGMEQIPYNRAYFTFVYREPFTRYFDDSGDADKMLSDFQSDINEFDAQLTYTLMDTDVNIADVAKVYRDSININKTVIENVGMRLQFLMAENKQSMFGRTKVEMATPDFVLSVAQDVSYYCKGLTVALTGYQRGGLGGAAPSVFPMANKSAYRSLGERLSMMDVSLSYTVDYLRAHERASFSDGNLLQNVSEQFIKLQDSREGSDVVFRLIKPSYSERLLSSDISKLNGFNAGLEVTNLGALLFSGYSAKGLEFTRTDLIDRNVRSIADSTVGMALSNPNDYMFGVLDSYVDAPIEYSAYLIETESVPFLQMVLGGSVPVYSEALNLDYTGQQLILKLIDSNVYPSFILTEQDAIELYGTDSQGIFTSSFEVWKYDVRNTYERVNEVLKEVVGQQIVRREAVANNVYVNTYSNGVKTVVNYSAVPYTYQGTLIDAMSAAAVR